MKNANISKKNIYIQQNSSSEERYSHRAVDNKCHHDIHVCNVLLEVGVKQVELCASEKQTTAKIKETNSA